jgi:hypothetical protein
LTGQAWLAFLDRTGHAVRFAEGAGHWLLAGTYDPSVRLPAGQYRALERETEQWIRTHRPGDG